MENAEKAIGSVYTQSDLRNYLELLDRILRLNDSGKVDLRTEELEVRINSIIKNNEF